MILPDHALDELRNPAAGAALILKDRHLSCPLFATPSPTTGGQSAFPRLLIVSAGLIGVTSLRGSS
jgi:hypothetical protein